MNRRWLVNRTTPEFLKFISGKASVSPVLAQILVNRGFKDIDSIKDFLYPALDKFHDPFLLPDMDKAVERIKTAIKNDETVFIHGDYDADGITSTALLVSALNKLKLKTSYHIPNRITEGYGISKKGIEKAKASGAALIITADCGISSETEVITALSMGMDVIVTDHHEPPDKLPAATAVVDPHRKDSKYPFKYLAGVGVAFKLVQALFQETGNRIQNTELNEYLDLVTLGTIADSVPLMGENRIFVTFGLKEINNGSCRAGVQALKKAAGIEKDFHSGLLSYTIIPRINAAGRLDDASGVVELFLTIDETKAFPIANLLEEQNKKRQKIEGEVFKSALDMIDPHKLDNAIVLASHDWHPGVVGIVASRLVEMFYRPVFLFSVNDSFAKGSARGIPPFHLYDAIAKCSGLLTGFGGHRQAAGLKMPVDNLDAFRKRMNDIVGKSLSVEDTVPTLEIDAAVSFSDLNLNLVKELSLLEPFGDSNREPMFGARNIEIVNHRIVGNNHLKMQLKQDRINLDTIGFRMADKLTKITPVSALDIAFVPIINEWNGNKNLQLNLKAIRPSV
ncbi:MAG: single-stranded-DNA-specific exonuclease RecJ [Nitrospirae bacterium]|nr:single-stranded-DNA-specific exonuclease RecJ [Nitrospirota bacterium]MBI4849992.1 single-stranded-DNA-specific exonuclease RecJ [Nitrospirota bacterium]